MKLTALRQSILRFVLAPILFTLGVTLLRLVGELRGWPSPWFDKTSGMVGITWFLPPIFGFYFGRKLWQEGEQIERIGRAIALAILGILLNQLVEATVFNYADISLYSMLLILWFVATISAYLQYLGWAALFKLQVAYGLGARIPVVVIMFFALRGHWGTHYDRPSGPFRLGFWPEFLWFGFFEELIYWVSYAVAVGALAGGIAAALSKWRMRESRAAR
jgi:hypothetical protein